MLQSSLQFPNFFFPIRDCLIWIPNDSSTLLFSCKPGEIYSTFYKVIALFLLNFFKFYLFFFILYNLNTLLHILLISKTHISWNPLSKIIIFFNIIYFPFLNFEIKFPLKIFHIFLYRFHDFIPRKPIFMPQLIKLIFHKFLEIYL